MFVLWAAPAAPPAASAWGPGAFICRRCGLWVALRRRPDAEGPRGLGAPGTDAREGRGRPLRRGGHAGWCAWCCRGRAPWIRRAVTTDPSDPLQVVVACTVIEGKPALRCMWSTWARKTEAVASARMPNEDEARFAALWACVENPWWESFTEAITPIPLASKYQSEAWERIAAPWQRRRAHVLPRRRASRCRCSWSPHRGSPPRCGCGPLVAGQGGDPVVLGGQPMARPRGVLSGDVQGAPVQGGVLGGGVTASVAELRQGDGVTHSVTIPGGATAPLGRAWRPCRCCTTSR